jgi:histidinol-phosphate/aromatic aminotransferase/cobyric acid decarboxylase-like protein
LRFFVAAGTSVTGRAAMFRRHKRIPTLTVDDVRRILEGIDGRVEFKVVDPTNPQGDPVSTRDIRQAVGNCGEAIALVFVRTE